MGETWHCEDWQFSVVVCPLVMEQTVSGHVWQSPAVDNFTPQASENCSHTNGSAAMEDHREPVSSP